MSTVNVQFEKLVLDAKEKLNRSIKEISEYKKFYLENSWNTDSISDSGYIIDMESGITKPYELKSRKVKALAPKAAVLIKKKAFSTLNFLNDYKYMSKNEIFLLRATKALFALKVHQIRTYEVLYKTKNFSEKDNSINNIAQIVSLIDKLNRSQSLSYSNSASFINENERKTYEAFLRNLTNTNYEYPGALGGLDTFSYKEGISDLMSLLKRSIYSHENLLTTFIVDYNNIENYGTGPGTGVIELANFSSISCSVSSDSNPSSMSLQLEDPYNISIISESDIDLAIEEALNGNAGIFKNLLDEDIKFTVGLNKFGLSSNNSFGKSQSARSASYMSGMNLSNLESFYKKAKADDIGVDIDYVLERLRTFYLGKPYVNPADGIHAFIQGNRTKFSKAFGSSVKSVESEIEGLSEAVIKAEMDLYTSGNIDIETYKKIRETNQFSLGMIHIFGGYITNSSTTYSQGVYKLSINSTDNMGWLNWARFNETPSIDDPQGILEDPLTPFKIPRNPDGQIDFSRPPELLDENKGLISSGLVSFDSGLLRGQNATEGNLLQGEFSGIGSSDGKRVFQHASGFVYDWKSGIHTAVADFEPSGSSGGENAANYQAYSSNYVLPTVKNVLNNLDVANIISILTTGKPYNVVNFLKNAKRAVTFMPEENKAALKNSNQDPLSSVVEIINKQNNFYGKFIPYKMITSGSQSYQMHIKNSSMKENASSQIKDLEIKRADLRDKIQKLKNTGGLGVVSQSAENIVRRLQLELDNIGTKINREVEALSKSGALESDVSSTPIFSLGQNDDGFLRSLKDEDETQRKIKSFIGTLRRIEDVRLNRDNNYFIVSDQYDASVEIKPFLLELKNSGYKLFQSSYTDNFSKCRQAAAFLNLEFFCNSQGHIELRPPQWNRIPLSVLKSLIKTKKMTGKNVIPDYIMNLYETKEANIVKEIQRMNVRTAIICLLLGKYPDASIIPGLANYMVSGPSSLSFFGVSEKGIERRYGEVGSESANLSFDFSENGNYLGGDVEAILGDFNAELSGSFEGVSRQTQDGQDVLASNEGSTIGGSGLINEILLYSKGFISPPAAKVANATTVNNIRFQFINMFGLDPAKDLLGDKDFFEEEDFVFYNKSETYSEKINRIINSSSGSGSLLSKLEQTISQRDKNVVLLKRNREKKEKFNQINSIFADSQNEDQEYKSELNDFWRAAEESLSYLSDTLNYQRDPSSPYDELIEDDTQNILGYGSGKRFIIKDEDVISATYNETPPEYTRVNVTGSAELGIGQNLDSISEGYYLWAGASDFDLWRQFGYKSQSFPVPFFSSANSQCKPYAYFMLQLQRSKINSANIQVVGNEFYQPGDTVYIESKGLLYYVRSVSHSLTYGQTFTTSLTLEYGHPPGTYMPNPLDLFGMQLTQNIVNNDVPVYRNSRGDDYYRELTPESSLKIPGIKIDGLKKLLSASDNQSRFYTMMLGLSSGGIIGGNKKLILRGFVRDSNSEKVNDLRASLLQIKELFKNPQMLSSGVPDRISGVSQDEFMNEVVSDPTGSVDPNKSGIGKIFGAALSSANPLNLASGRLVPMKLPNGELARGIADKDIIIQISYLDKNNSKDEISCLDPSFLSSFLDETGNLNDVAKMMMPSGGMKQSTWLDFRNGLSLLGGVVSLVEVGIVDFKSYGDFEAIL